MYWYLLAAEIFLVARSYLPTWSPTLSLFFKFLGRIPSNSSFTHSDFMASLLSETARLRLSSKGQRNVISPNGTRIHVSITCWEWRERAALCSWRAINRGGLSLVLGHLFHSLVCLHRSLIHLLHTACCAHSFARSLTPKLVGKWWLDVSKSGCSLVVGWIQWRGRASP